MPVPGDMPMIRSDATMIAETVIELMANQHWIPGSIPREIADWISQQNRQYAVKYSSSIPLNGGEWFTQNWTLAPTGALSLELCDVNGAPFWRGTFEPVASANGR